MAAMAAKAVETGEDGLVAELRAGRASAYTALMRRNNQRLYRLARGVLSDDAEAEEAVQEGYVRAFTHLDGFKGEASIATWLARIVLNEAMARRPRRRPTVDIDALSDTLAAAEEAPFVVERAPTPEQATARQEIRRAIERAVDALPAGFRSVFMLRAIEQMSVEETALALGIAEATVKTRLHRARRLLRQALAEHLGLLLDDAFPFLGARCDRIVATVLARLAILSPSAPAGDRPAPRNGPP